MNNAPQTIDDILSKINKDAPFLKGATSKRNYRSVDRFPDHQLGTITPYTPPAPKVCSYDNLKLRVWQAMTARAKKYNRALHFDTRNKAAMETILKTMLDPTERKGIFLVGSWGTGKSFVIESILQAILYLSYQYDNIKPISMHRYESIMQGVLQEKSDLYIQNQLRGSVFIDDIGYQEQYTVKVWGNTHNVIDLITTRLYTLYDHHNRIIATGNYSIDIMLENGMCNHGSASRMREIFKEIIWYGPDLRI